MKDYVFLEYMFIFEPKASWQRLYEFEKDLAKFFADHGLEAEVMRMIEGGSTRHALLIKKKEVIEEPKPLKEKPVSTKKMFEKLRPKK